ncbi:hypothetical protein BH11GEM2_BH11GEM2_33760 [soil metagenome]
MPQRQLLIVGAGHLALRTRSLAIQRGLTVTYLGDEAYRAAKSDETTLEALVRALGSVSLDTLAHVYLVDERDERNLELLIALISINRTLPIVAALFNENIAPHLRAAHPNILVLNPAKIAAPAFIAALDQPLQRTLRYVPAAPLTEPAFAPSDHLIHLLLGTFALICAGAVMYFRQAMGLSWVDALYFVVVTVATVGYGDISLRDQSMPAKLVGIGLILCSTVFIWMIFSLTIDSIIRRRVQSSLGRRRYSHRNHVIICGLGRLGYFIAEGLLERGEKVLIVEKDESSGKVQHFRSRGADVYLGDARLPRVLQDVGVERAKALYSVIDNDYANLEIGLNARSIAPDMRLILRIFDRSMSEKLRENLDIHLTLSMTAIAHEIVLDATGTQRA